MTALHIISHCEGVHVTHERNFIAQITHRDKRAYNGAGLLTRRYASIESARVGIINWLFRDGRAGSSVIIYHNITAENRALAKMSATGRITLELYGAIK